MASEGVPTSETVQSCPQGREVESDSLTPAFKDVTVDVKLQAEAEAEVTAEVESPAPTLYVGDAAVSSSPASLDASPAASSPGGETQSPVAWSPIGELGSFPELRELEEYLEDDKEWTIFEDSEDEIRHLKRRSEVLARGLVASREEALRLHTAGYSLQEAYESLQQELRQLVGDVAYWRALAEARGEELACARAELSDLAVAPAASPPPNLPAPACSADAALLNRTDTEGTVLGERAETEASKPMLDTATEFPTATAGSRSDVAVAAEVTFAQADSVPMPLAVAEVRQVATPLEDVTNRVARVSSETSAEIEKAAVVEKESWEERERRERQQQREALRQAAAEAAEALRKRREQRCAAEAAATADRAEADTRVPGTPFPPAMSPAPPDAASAHGPGSFCARTPPASRGSASPPPRPLAFDLGVVPNVGSPRHPGCDGSFRGCSPRKPVCGSRSGCSSPAPQPARSALTCRWSRGGATAVRSSGLGLGSPTRRRVPAHAQGRMTGAMSPALPVKTPPWPPARTAYDGAASAPAGGSDHDTGAKHWRMAVR